MKHKSVLLNEAIEYLQLKEDGNYIDATLGYAGHSSIILKTIRKGYLIAFDKDIEAINYSRSILADIGENFKIFNTGFINLKKVVQDENKSIDGILFDLGISSPEIDEAQRGFSYMKDAPLDMRMNKNSDFSAYNVINEYDENKLTDIFRKYGEEKHAHRIANEIIKQREITPIETTFNLVDIIDKCYPYKEKRKGHPAKKVFQAIRIEVNNELGEFETAIKEALDIIKVGGRVVVITFHSLEDRICKTIFNEVSKVDEVVKGMPNIPLDKLPDFKLITTKPIIPSDEEINNNARSKSAKMRVIEKIK